jgi:hypothetical protein
MRGVLVQNGSRWTRGAGSRTRRTGKIWITGTKRRKSPEKEKKYVFNNYKI